MQETKVVLKFPISESQVKTVLEDASKIIKVIVSGLANNGDYKYISIESIFALTSNEVFANALKSIAIDNTITFDTPKANAVIVKNIDNLTTDIVLSSLLIASFEITFEVSQELGFGATANLESISQKSIQITDQIGISSEVKFIVNKWATAQSEFEFELNNPITVLSKATSAMSQFGFGSSANAIISNVVDRLRTLFDIDSLTLADIDNWTMAEFDRIQQ